MRDFILTCRERESLIKLVGNRSNLMNDLEFYSLRDFFEASRETLHEFILDLSERFITHIKVFACWKSYL